MLVFKTSAINRSAIPPRGNEEHVAGAKSIVHFPQMLKRGFVLTIRAGWLNNSHVSVTQNIPQGHIPENEQDPDHQGLC